MTSFYCTHCNSQIQADTEFVGKMVECPLCSKAQIVPDPPMRDGTALAGCEISGLISSSLLWSTYLATGASKFPGQQLIIKLPSAFFKYNVTDWDTFVKYALQSGGIGIPGFPELLDYKLNAKNPYFIFDSCDAVCSLATVAENQEAIDPTFALQLSRKVAQALAIAWQNNRLLHQNLNPDNIFLGETHEPQIVDIGLGEYLLTDQKLLDGGFNIWDVRYMSPEFVRDGNCSSSACDIYSLGGILYLFLTGRHPFEEVDFENIESSPTPNPREHANVPDGIFDLQQRMMARDLESRLNNWSDVLAEIDELLLASAQGERAEAKKKVIPPPEAYTKSESVGLKVGPFKKERASGKMKKKAKTKTPAPDNSTDTVAKLAKVKTKREAGGINQDWEKKTPRKKRSGKPVPKKDNTTAIIFLSVFVIVGIVAAVLILVFMSNSSKKVKKAQAAPSAETKTEADAKADAKPATKKPAVVNDKGPSLLDQLADADKYNRDNHEDILGSLKKYEDLRDKAIEKKKLRVLDAIQKRIKNLKVQLSEMPAAERAALKKPAGTAEETAKPAEAAAEKPVADATPEATAEKPAPETLATPDPAATPVAETTPAAEKPAEAADATVDGEKPAEAAPEVKKPQTTAELNKELLQVNQFIKDNPQDHDGIIAKLEALQENAIDLRATGVVDLLRDRIFAVEEAKEASLPVTLKLFKK